MIGQFDKMEISNLFVPNSGLELKPHKFKLEQGKLGPEQPEAH